MNVIELSPRERVAALVRRILAERAIERPFRPTTICARSA